MCSILQDNRFQRVLRKLCMRLWKDYIIEDIQKEIKKPWNSLRKAKTHDNCTLQK